MHVDMTAQENRVLIDAGLIRWSAPGLTDSRAFSYSSLMFTAQAHPFALPLIADLLPAMLLLRLAH